MRGAKFSILILTLGFSGLLVWGVWFLLEKHYSERFSQKDAALAQKDAVIQRQEKEIQILEKEVSKLKLKEGRLAPTLSNTPPRSQKSM